MGGTAVKVGIQLAGRVDLMTVESADALKQMSDSMEPIALDDALERIERAVGRPLEGVFSALDPEPILSTTVLTAYQGLLSSGEKVVVKVRRPEAAGAFAAELYSLKILLGMLEFFTVVRPGFFTHLRRELQSMLTDELDFVKTARHHRIFNKELKRARLDHRYRAAVVYSDLSNEEVMVSEFVSGFWLGEVLAAVRDGDAAFIAQLADAGIEPRRLARRTLQLSWWSLFETYLFYAEPLPANMVVEADNRLVLVNLSDTGEGTVKSRELQERVLAKLARDDVSGAVEAYLHWVAPLPLVDIVDLRQRLETSLWDALFALRDPVIDAGGCTSREVWHALASTATACGVPVRLEVAQRMRAALLYDDLAVGLHPSLRLLKEFDRYRRGSAKRELRRRRRDLRKSYGGDSQRAAANVALRAGSTVERAGFLFEVLSRQVPPEFQPMTVKGAYAASVVIRTLAMAGALLVSAIAVATGWLWWSGMSAPGTVAASLVLYSPITWLLALLGFAVALRRISFRLDDRDYD
jgi:predicted unusual protein kinase regulating ubiquinone biosynthesis (AarF/ABC1/UbiB family)